MIQQFNSQIDLLSWLLNSLQESLEKDSDQSKKSSVLNYMSYGYAIGFDRSELQSALITIPDIYKIAINFSNSDIYMNKPLPVFEEGSCVEVIVNERNKTYHRGIIVGRSWHFKDKKWYFKINENGKVLKKKI